MAAEGVMSDESDIPPGRHFLYAWITTMLLIGVLAASGLCDVRPSPRRAPSPAEVEPVITAPASAS